MDQVSHFEPELVKVGKVWMEKELELRFSVLPPPLAEESREGPYLKNGTSAEGACGIFMYHDNTIVNLRGIRKLTGLHSGAHNFSVGPPYIFKTSQIPCVEIEEMNIGLGDSKIFTTKAVKADSVQFKANTNFYIALSEFINCFLKHHMYFRNISEEAVEAEKQKKEQAKLEQAALTKAMEEQAAKLLAEKEKVQNVVISPPKQRTITQMMQVVKPKVEVKEESDEEVVREHHCGDPHCWCGKSHDSTPVWPPDEEDATEEEKALAEQKMDQKIKAALLEEAKLTAILAAEAKEEYQQTCRKMIIEKESEEESEEETEEESIEVIKQEVKNEIIQTSQTKEVKKRPHITKANKEMIAADQDFKCNNSPDGAVSDKNTTNGCEDYKCPFWRLNGGHFDKSLYEVDHIDQDRTNIHRENLQALCPCCHSVKTRKNQRKPLPKDETLEFIE